MNSAIKKVYTKHVIKHFPVMYIDFDKYTKNFSINGFYNDNRQIPLQPSITKPLRQDGYFLCSKMTSKQMNWYVQKYNTSLNAVVFRNGDLKWFNNWAEFDQIWTINQDNN